LPRSPKLTTSTRADTSFPGSHQLLMYNRLVKEFDTNKIRSREVNSPFGMSRSRLSARDRINPEFTFTFKREDKRDAKNSDYFVTTTVAKNPKSKPVHMNMFGLQKIDERSSMFLSKLKLC
jgi:hypothetical protein